MSETSLISWQKFKVRKSPDFLCDCCSELKIYAVHMCVSYPEDNPNIHEYIMCDACFVLLSLSFDTYVDLQTDYSYVNYVKLPYNIIPSMEKFGCIRLPIIGGERY